MADAKTKADLAALGHVPMPVLKAIRAKCLDCSSGVRAEVDNCSVRQCPLYPFRGGRNRWKSEPTEEQRERARKLSSFKKPRPLRAISE